MSRQFECMLSGTYLAQYQYSEEEYITYVCIHLLVNVGRVETKFQKPLTAFMNLSWISAYVSNEYALFCAEFSKTFSTHSRNVK